MKKKILALIGIRAGSKGLKNKNIKKLGNKHLVGWIINAAKKSKYINRIIVSTESKNYARIAMKYGAEVPFLRKKELAKDSSNEIDFIKFTIKKLNEIENYQPHIIVRLLATCPFQKATDIDKTIEKVLDKKINSAVLISEAKQHPMKALRIVGKKNKKLVSFYTGKGIDVGYKSNRQRFEKAYFRSNVIATKKKVIDRYNSLTDNNVRFIKTDNQFFVDIDSFEDFNYAEYLSKKNKSKI
jgi:CMP-N,N'-diacetyllegionaminic acid synthase